MGLFSAISELAEMAEARKKNSEPKPIGEWHAAGRATLSQRAQKRYAAAFATPNTAPRGANELGILPMACLMQLYRYEKRGLVRRTGHVVSGSSSAAILWEWIK